MAKMTKAQKKRMVRDIQNKAKKLFMDDWSSARKEGRANVIVNVADVTAIEKLCTKWMKRIG